MVDLRRLAPFFLLLRALILVVLLLGVFTTLRNADSEAEDADDWTVGLAAGFNDTIGTGMFATGGADVLLAAAAGGAAVSLAAAAGAVVLAAVPKPKPLEMIGVTGRVGVKFATRPVPAALFTLLSIPGFVDSLPIPMKVTSEGSGAQPSTRLGL